MKKPEESELEHMRQILEEYAERRRQHPERYFSEDLVLTPEEDAALDQVWNNFNQRHPLPGPTATEEDEEEGEE